MRERGGGINGVTLVVSVALPYRIKLTAVFYRRDSLHMKWCGSREHLLHTLNKNE